MHNIYTHTCTYIHPKTSNTYKIQEIWIDISPVSCMYLVCMTLLNVEYIHHTCTYMTHTGMCNLIYTAYRISCICMYHIVCMYLCMYHIICRADLIRIKLPIFMPFFMRMRMRYPRGERAATAHSRCTCSDSTANAQRLQVKRTEIELQPAQYIHVHICMYLGQTYSHIHAHMH